MQSAILLALMVLVSIFIISESNRNSNTEIDNYAVFKANNVAGNVLQYKDSLVQYILVNYELLHLRFSTNGGNVDKITLIDYAKDGLNSYSQKNLLPFLNYQSVVFNYGKAPAGEIMFSPILYTATSFDGYTGNIVKSYAHIKLPEVMGVLGEKVSKPVYQGDSTYWTVPWLFRQSNCNIKEIYSQLPADADGYSNKIRLRGLFNLWCNQIHANSSYRFLTYVYMQPVFMPANI